MSTMTGSHQGIYHFILKMSNLPKVSEFEETFRYNEIYFGKIQVDKNTTKSVTIEQFIEGSPFVKYVNNTGRFSMVTPQLLCRRWKHLLIFHIRSAKVSCWLTYKALATNYVTLKLQVLTLRVRMVMETKIFVLGICQEMLLSCS